MYHPQSIPAPAAPPAAARQTAVPAGWVMVGVAMAALLALRVASGPTANAGYVLLAAYALLGRAHAVRALALCWLFNMISPGIAPEASLASIGRYAVLFGAAASVMLRSGLGARRRPLALPTVLLGLFIVGHSLLLSPMADVSVLKAVSWTMATATVIAAWNGLSAWEREQLAQQLFWGLVLVLVASLPLAVLPLGYLRNSTGFQGILNHPQAFGPAMALLCAWATARLLGDRNPPWWLLALAGTSLAAVVMSEARTAGLAAVVGVGLAVLLGAWLGGQPIGRVAPGLTSGRVWAVLLGVLLAAVAFASAIVALVHHYITKSGRADVGSLVEAYERSRGRLIDIMLANIAEHPLTGIGFGLASEPWTMHVERDPVLGLPVGASVEKGVTPLMVLEELGIFGAALVALLVLGLIRGSARGGLAPFAVCLTALALNMGAATLFSPGGFGLLLLILLGWAYTSGQPPARPRYG